MSSVAKKVRAHYQSIYDRATADLTRYPEGYVKDQVLVAIAGMMRVTEEEARLSKAKRIVEFLSKPIGEDDEDDEYGEQQYELELAGHVYPYDPHRLVDASGYVVENKNAMAIARLAESERARVNAERAQTWANRRAREAELQAKWALEQASKGRPALELTWDNCVRETGILRER
jgi:hypothetical protein